MLSMHMFIYAAILLKVFHQGDVGTHWYAVISGSLDVCLVDSDCPEKVIKYRIVYCMF